MPSEEGRDADGQRENSVETPSQEAPPLVRRASAPSSLRILNRMNSDTATETSTNATARRAIDFYSDFCQKHGGSSHRGIKKRHRRRKSMDDADMSSPASARRSKNRALDDSLIDNASATLDDVERGRKKGRIREQTLSLKHFSDIIGRSRRLPSASSRNVNNALDNISKGGRHLSSPTSDSSDDDVSHRSCEAVAGDNSVSNTTLASSLKDSVCRIPKIAAEVGIHTPEPERGPAPERFVREAAGHGSLRQDEESAHEEGRMAGMVESIPEFSTEIGQDFQVGHMPGMVESFDLIYSQLGNRAEAAKQIVNLLNTQEEQRIAKSQNVYCQSSPVDTAGLPHKRVWPQLPLPTNGLGAYHGHRIEISAKSQNDPCQSSPVDVESCPANKRKSQFPQPRLPLPSDDWRAYLEDDA